MVAVSVASLVRADCAQLELLGNGLQGEVAKIPLAVRGIARGALGGLEKVEPIYFHVNLIQYSCSATHSLVNVLLALLAHAVAVWAEDDPLPHD